MTYVFKANISKKDLLRKKNVSLCAYFYRFMTPEFENLLRLLSSTDEVNVRLGFHFTAKKTYLCV
jgi:hypothetical protein